MPYGFFHIPLPGFLPGYPVVMENGLSARRTAEFLTYMLDGGYLNKVLSKSLTAQVMPHTLLCVPPRSRPHG